MGSHRWYLLPEIYLVAMGRLAGLTKVGRVPKYTRSLHPLHATFPVLFPKKFNKYLLDCFTNLSDTCCVPSALNSGAATN